MKRNKRRFSKIEKLMLATNVMIGAAFVFYIINPGFFEDEFWRVSIKGNHTPILLLANFLLIFFWLAKTRYQFTISLFLVLIYYGVVLQTKGSDKFQASLSALLFVPVDQVDNEVLHNYITENADLPAHPRLLFKKEDEEALKKAITSNSDWGKMHHIIITEADRLVNSNIKTRKVKGLTLPGDPRDCFRRALFLSYAWRVTKQQKYLESAKSDLIAIASMDNWDPTNALSVAEITAGLAIGYDWLYNDLSVSDRLLFEKAISEKGLKPTFDSYYNSWIDEISQKNQVCNAGAICGALAIFENQSKYSSRIINHSLSSLLKSMSIYGKDGSYPSGYQSDTYATTFTAMAIDGLTQSFGKDFGLTAPPGFLKNGLFLQNLIGPTTNPYHYSDAVLENDFPPNPSLFWLADKNNDPSLLWEMYDIISHGTDKNFNYNRTLPLSVIWGTKSSTPAKPTIPSENTFVANGSNAVALMRTSWTNKNAIYVGLKAGQASNNLGHADIGSFILEANNKRWAVDLGGDNIPKIEGKGINALDMSQNSKRWDIFRISNKSHNIFTVNEGRQQVNAIADIDRFSKSENNMFAITDLSKVYQGSLKSAQRGIGIIDSKVVRLRDEIVTLNGDNRLRWKIVTPAKIKLLSNNVAELTIDDEKYYLKILEPLNVKLQTWSANMGHLYEKNNDGNTILGFDLAQSGSAKISVTALFGDDLNKINALTTIKSINQW